MASNAYNNHMNNPRPPPGALKLLKKKLKRKKTFSPSPKLTTSTVNVQSYNNKSQMLILQSKLEFANNYVIKL